MFGVKRKQISLGEGISHAFADAKNKSENCEISFISHTFVLFVNFPTGFKSFCRFHRTNTNKLVNWPNFHLAKVRG